MLRITEIFRSIQGESTQAGRPCTFVRLTGCPMRCVWCDSEYTFTGGEPLAQKEALTLIQRLCDEDFEVLIETGGYFSTEGIDERARVILDVKCPGSGEADRNHWPNLERLRADRDEVKFVIASRADWDFGTDVIKRFELERRTLAVLISPAWGEIDLQDLAEWVATSGLNLRMQLQLHKYVWGPEARGV